MSDHLSAIVMEPQRRDSILARTRQIIRKNLPPMEGWFLKRDDIFSYVRPSAGAFVYCEYKSIFVDVDGNGKFDSPLPKIKFIF